MKRYAGFLIFTGLVLAFSCSDSGGGGNCVDTLCTAGHSECMGNYKAVCQMDGRGWILDFCGSRGYCENGVCKKGVCQPGFRFCEDKNRATVCNDMGTEQKTVTCGPGQECQYGFCMERKCTDGEVLCNNNERVICVSGLWTTEQCPDGQACNPEEKACMDLVCTPFQAVCSKDKTKSYVCNNNGSGYTTTNCGADETCVNGFCMKNLCAPVHDAVVHEDLLKDAADMSEDTLPRDGNTGFDVPADLKNQAEINGTVVEFSGTHEASYLPGEYKLRIVLKDVPAGIGDHRNQVTIMITGIQENQTGTFNCQDQGVTSVNMYYKFGKYPDDGDCAEYDYVATKCSITITKFGPRQGIVSGTFSASVMQDCKQDSTSSVIKNGEFNVFRIF